MFADFEVFPQESQVPVGALKKLDVPFYLRESPACLFQHLHHMVLGEKPESPFPFITGVNPKSRIIVEVSNYILHINRHIFIQSS